MLTYAEVKTNHNENSRIPYSDLLNTKEWHDHREIIIERDDYICVRCRKASTIPVKSKKGNIVYIWIESKPLSRDTLLDDPLENEFVDFNSDLSFTVAAKPYCLQVHHNYYLLGKLPWEYEDDALVTLCNWCHTEFHENNYVCVYRNQKEVEHLTLTICSRCSGVGSFSKYSHVQNGICFQCRGSGYYYPEILAI